MARAEVSITCQTPRARPQPGAMSASDFGTVVITGASGFIGRRLRDALLDRGVDVVALRRAASPEPDRGRSVAVDYADVEGLTEVFRAERPTHVLHVAGATKGVTYADFARANVMPTEHLVEAAKTAGADLGRFVLVSSLAAWGPSNPETPHAEEDPPRPVEHYGRSKLEAEQKLEASGLPYTILRPGGVYGPGDVDYFELFKTAHGGLNFYFGNRRRWMSVVYVDDLVDLVLSAAVHPAAVGRGYFVADGVPVTWEGFQTLVCEAAGRKVRDLDIPEVFVGMAAWGGELLSRLDGRPRLANRQKATMGRQQAWTGSIERARSELGFSPKVDQAEGVKRAMAWYREQRWLR